MASTTALAPLSICRFEGPCVICPDENYPEAAASGWAREVTSCTTRYHPACSNPVLGYGQFMVHQELIIGSVIAPAFASISLFASGEKSADPRDPEPSHALVITPQVEEEEYCRDRNGVDQVRLSVRLTYSNQGSEPLIVPILARLSGFTIHGEHLSKPIRVRHKLSTLDGISPEVYKTVIPNPHWFWVLAPGQSRGGVRQFVVLRLAENGTSAKRGLHPGEYRFEADLNFGVRLQHDPIVLADRWKEIGNLVPETVHSDAITLKVGGAKHSRCITPRAIL